MGKKPYKYRYAYDGAGDILRQFIDSGGPVKEPNLKADAIIAIARILATKNVDFALANTQTPDGYHKLWIGVFAITLWDPIKFYYVDWDGETKFSAAIFPDETIYTIYEETQPAHWLAFLLTWERLILEQQQQQETDEGIQG